MFPSEIAVLISVEEAERLTLQQLTRVTDLTGTPLRYFCNSLVRRGYLEEHNSQGYQVTVKGKKAILEALNDTNDGIPEDRNLVEHVTRL
jgi:predicted transcriptional regulator